MSKFLSIVYPIPTSLMPLSIVYVVSYVVSSVFHLSWSNKAAALSWHPLQMLLSRLLYISSSIKCRISASPHCISLNHADRLGQITVSGGFSPLSSSSPSFHILHTDIPEYSPGLSQIGRRALHISFWLPSSYLLYIRTVSPPRRVFGSPTRYQSSSISIRPESIHPLPSSSILTMQSP